MPVKNTPPLGAKGIYTLRTPFTAPADQLYKCIAIRSFKDFVDGGENVFDKFYQTNSIPEETYLEDLAAGANIITLQSDTSTTIYVPDTYIEKLPDLTAVPYKRIVLSIELAPLPDSVDLTFLKEHVAEVVSDITGVEGTVREHVAPYSGVVSEANHEVAEAARQAAITNRTTSYAQLIQAKATIDRQTVLIQGLEDYVKNQQP